MQSIESLLATIAVKRSVGSKENDQLRSFCETHARSLGFEVQSQQVPSYASSGSLSFLTLAEESCTVLPSPFSRSCSVQAPLVFASQPSALKGLDASSSLLVLHGRLAAEPIDDEGLLGLISSTKAKAIICLTSSHATTGLSPFPLIRSAEFPIPSCYAPSSLLESLLQAKEDRLVVPLQLFCETKKHDCRQLFCTLPDSTPNVLVTAPLDTPQNSPGALFHASSIAVMLVLMEHKPKAAVAYLLSNAQAYGQGRGKAAFLQAKVPPIEQVVSLTGLGCRQSQLVYQSWDSSLKTDIEKHGLEATDALLPRFACELPELVLTSSNQRLLSSVRDTQLDTLACIDLQLLKEQAQTIGELLTYCGRFG
ncbi:hypothetical protein [uncultured Sphaerochaeta sp.]|uniref:hypothetical protein n=1 Tax=uncultured Sphaerochaeta sp. TaxID=886478 RepID=UPI00261168F5|nr:hypothetical protein [uncultured Sphaerochaeta sp.]